LRCDWLSVDGAIEDFRRAREKGLVGMMIPGHPVPGDYDKPEYDALWACAVDLDMPLAFHILTFSNLKSSCSLKSSCFMPDQS